jgi:integrase
VLKVSTEQCLPSRRRRVYGSAKFSVSRSRTSWTTALGSASSKNSGKASSKIFSKTTNGKRYVELHSSIAALLRGHIGQRKSGYVFCTEDGEPLDQSNILSRVLHPILAGDEKTPGIVVNINGKNFQGVKAGAQIFRSFRNSHLRASNVPAGLLKYWMGHSRKQDMTDVYDKSSEDTAWRAQVAEQIGTGFTVPNCTDCTEKEKEATGAVASK